MFYTAIVSQVASYEHVHRTNMSLDRGQHNGEPSGYFGVIVSEVEYNDNVSHYDPVDEVKASWNITQPAHLPVDGTGACYCKTELHSSYDSYVVCECYGEHLTSIPCSNFTLGVKRMSLKGNNKLTYIADDAFVGLRNLQILDLSETSIKRLPINGLQSLEILRLRDTYTLKVIPSIYNFKSIKEAHLTYAHHCCAFNFPATHDQAEVYDIFARDMKKRFCSRQQSANSMSVEQFRTNPVASLVASKQGQWFHVDAMLGHKGHRRQRRNGKQAGQLFEKSEKSAKSERRQRSKLSTPRGQQNGFHVDRQGDLDPSLDMDYGPKDKGNNSFGHIVHQLSSEAKSSKSSLDRLRSTMQTSGSDSDENDALGAPPMGFNPVIRDDQVPQSSKDSLTAHSDMDGTGYGDDSEVGYIHHVSSG
ncbi:Follicle-stimulating hormone receptor [Halotydeus destructor]|nr:Follicle-stimulating hormone receptor [Halotydeus destructor]